MNGKKIEILVNNAGLAVGLEKLYEYNMEDVDRMVDTNIKDLHILLTQYYLL